MTREQEIREKAKEIAENSVGERTKNHPANLLHIICVKDACIEMAEWADQHPRKGLWDSEKVIKWLRNNQQGFILTDMDIEYLRKAMEE